jgi:hypothetical protein
MAVQAGDAVVYITAHALVLIVHILLVVLVAVDAAENGIVAGIGMTVGALVPLSIVLPGINREVLHVVVEGGRLPGVLTMAYLAVGRILGSRMIGIVCLEIIRCMTTVAGVGGTHIITVVTICTVVGNGGVGTKQYIVIIMHRETRRAPSRDGSMAGTAIEGKPQCSVAGIA